MGASQKRVNPFPVQSKKKEFPIGLCSLWQVLQQRALLKLIAGDDERNADEAARN